MPQKLLFVFFLVCSVLFEQSIYAQKIERKHINYAFGLSNSQITSIKQDSLGFMWVGTQGGGVYRWDGKDLKPLHDSLKYEIIRDVLPTVNGTWVLSAGKIYNIDQNNKIESYTKPIYSRLKKSHLSNDDQFLRIYQINHKRFILCSFSGKLLLINDKGEVLDEANLGEWGLKTSSCKDTVYIYSNETLTKVTLNSDKLKIQKTTKIFDNINLDSKDKRKKLHFLNEQWWLQVQDRLMVLDENFNFLMKIKLPISSHIYRIETWENDIWLATNEGLFRTDFHGNELKIISKEVSTQVFNLVKTKEGLWASTLNGMFHFTRPKFYLLESTNSDGINGYFAYESIDGYLWAGSFYSGIHIYDGEEMIDKINFEIGNMNDVRAIVHDGDSVWIGTSAGLFKIHKETHQFRKIHIVKSNVISIEKLKNGVGVGTESEGFWIFNNTEVKHFNHKKGLYDPTIWSSKLIKDRIFLGSELGLFTLENDSVQKFKVNKSIDNAPITAVEPINDSTIAVGYAKYGVYIYDINEYKILHHFNDNNGLSSSFIYFLKLIDKNLWVGSSLGIDVVEISNSYDIFQLQDVSKLGGAETFLNGITKYQNRIIASTVAGAVLIPDDFVDLKSDVIGSFNPIIIEKVEPLSFASVDNFMNLVQEEEKLTIPFDYGSMKFHFNVAHFGAEKLKFLYQLEGYEDAISSASDEKFAIYKQLPAGEYTFKVWRSFHNQKVGDPAIFSFIITTPFYLKSEFRISLVIFLFVLIGLFIIIRARAKTAKVVEMIEIRESAQNDLRKEMAIDFHDEMGNHLAKIINLSGVLKMWGLQNEQEKVVSKIENAANALFISTKDLIWSLRKENNNLEEVYFHAKDFAESLLDKTDVKFRAIKNNNAEHINLNPKAARDLSLIIKEALTNVYKHANANNVEMNFEILPDNQAEISIIDDGIGCIDFSNKNGNGLKNMKQRALRSDLLFDQIASENKGCEIKIRINQHKKQAHV